MEQKTGNGIAAIMALRDIIDANSSLEVMANRGERWRASFSFGAPAELSSLELTQLQLGIRLPPAYIAFLRTWDGARLYTDAEYGQWGFWLYGTSDLMPMNTKWRKRYNTDWALTYVAFAESFGDADLLVLDTGQLVDDDQDCRVIDGDSGYKPAQWRAAARSFDAWLERLVIAQGVKYWRWL